jgi:hypothetical protein
MEALQAAAQCDSNDYTPDDQVKAIVEEMHWLVELANARLEELEALHHA